MNSTFVVLDVCTYTRQFTVYTDVITKLLCRLFSTNVKKNSKAITIFSNFLVLFGLTLTLKRYGFMLILYFSAFLSG